MGFERGKNGVYPLDIKRIYEQKILLEGYFLLTVWVHMVICPDDCGVGREIHIFIFSERRHYEQTMICCVSFAPFWSTLFCD